MKKLITLFIIVIILFSLCACKNTIVDDNGEKRAIYDGTFVEIAVNIFDSNYTVYDKNTKIVYYLETSENSDGGHLSPYLIYQDGAIYGAIFENGEIKPVPYAYAPLG